MPYTARTLADLRLRLAARWESKPFWEPEEARLAINEALSFFNLLTGRWRTRVSLPTTANALIYTAPAPMLYRMRMTWNLLPVRSSSREELNLGRTHWRQETTASGGDVPTRPIVFAPVDLTHFYLWPADAIGTATLALDGVADTPVLNDDGDTVDLGDELLNILLGMSLHVACFKKGGPYFAATTPLYKAFLAAAAEENGQIKSSQAYRRVMGLDRRDLKPLRGSASALSGFDASAAQPQEPV